MAEIVPGTSHPLGATPDSGGVQFSVYSRDADRLELLLFDRADDPAPSRTIALDPLRHRSYHYWHVRVEGIGPGQIYGWRAGGPFDPGRGLRFDPSRLLLDPYGRCVAVPSGYRREVVTSADGGGLARAMKSVVADTSAYDWEGDEPPAHPFSRTIIYEMHVGSFTRHPSSGVAGGRRGTYAGLVEKIPYLVDLGITAVELLPVFQFDPLDAPPARRNDWGYAPVSFFAPHAGYGSREGPLATLDEFRDMVKALHRAGLEVILDVVYNHTAEGNHQGPMFCFKGLANDAYYILDQDRAFYANYTGTGNTLNANHPVVRRLITDSLRYWVREMHVDGFRFDLASILARDETGRPLPEPPVLWDIESDPVLAGTKLIAEAWDAAGLYQVGTFVGDSWKEWNGRFRDDVRRFVRGDAGMAGVVAGRLLGSPDLYGGEEREPEQSVHFVSCHDGFTMNDLVSYDVKHNEANGEGNRDGSNDNLSWNCGVEGPSDDAGIEALRLRQIRNFFAVTLLAVGAPMILMGDEVRRTQGGNNNAWCQDNETSWFDWSLVEKNAGLLRFVQRLIAARVRRRDHHLTLNQLLRAAKLTWHGVRLNQPDWGSESHTLSVTIEGLDGSRVLHFIANAWWEGLAFELPERPPDRPWRRWFDTTLSSPEDIVDEESAPRVTETVYHVGPRSMVGLVSEGPARPGHGDGEP
jgi:isoamylase